MCFSYNDFYILMVFSGVFDQEWSSFHVVYCFFLLGNFFVLSFLWVARDVSMTHELMHLSLAIAERVM